VVARVKCEGEWHSIVLSATFVAVYQFARHDNGPLEQQKQDSHVCRRNCKFPLILKKNLSHYKDDEV